MPPPHFPNLEPEIRARLEARGIDPEVSCELMLFEIRYGRWLLDPPGRCLECGVPLSRCSEGCGTCSRRHATRRWLSRLSEAL